MHVCPTGEVLLAKDSYTLFHTSEGKYSRKTHLKWTDPVVSLTSSPHYIVALLPDAIEVRFDDRMAEQRSLEQ